MFISTTFLKEKNEIKCLRTHDKYHITDFCTVNKQTKNKLTPYKPLLHHLNAITEIDQVLFTFWLDLLAAFTGASYFIECGVVSMISFACLFAEMNIFHVVCHFKNLQVLKFNPNKLVKCSLIPHKDAKYSRFLLC